MNKVERDANIFWNASLVCNGRVKKQVTTLDMLTLLTDMSYNDHWRIAAYCQTLLGQVVEPRETNKDGLGELVSLFPDFSPRLSSTTMLDSLVGKTFTAKVGLPGGITGRKASMIIFDDFYQGE